MKKRLSISFLDIQLINKITFPNSELIIVFGADKSIAPTTKSKVFYLNDKTELAQFIGGIKYRFTLVNYSEETLSHLETHALFQGVLDFSRSEKASYQQYLFINNPDGSIRWFFPKTNKTPCFLNLYNGSGWKANLFVKASKFLNKVKALPLITDGHFSVYYKNNEIFKTNFPRIPFDDFAVFTGTIGENRKAIIALSKNGLTSQFIKIPLTDAALKLVRNEFHQLSSLDEFSYTHTIIPKVKYKNSQIMVSNILPNQKKKNQGWSTIHWQSIGELYQNSHQIKPLTATSFWATIVKGISSLNSSSPIKNGLSKEKFTSLRKIVEEIFYELDPTDLIPLAIGHGDFTPWNMYVGENQLHIYDWEMSQPNFPILFDVFHYFFQKGILINNENYHTIWKDIEVQLNSQEARDLLTVYKIDQDLHFKLYLLYIVCYYLPKYISQPKLHDQVHWLVSTWLEAFQNIRKEKKLA